MKPKVLNRHHGLHSHAVYIGRPSKWGNPYVIGKHGDRDQVIALYRDWLYSRPEMIAAAKAELKGRDLACYCAPCKCHGDILLKIANS